MRAGFWWLLLWLASAPASAHLLNMTKVQVNVEADGRLVVDLQIDISRSAGGGLEYYRLSRVPQPLADPEVRGLLERLAASISLQLDDTTLPLEFTAAQLPQSAREVFLDPLSWPMTQLRLTARLPPHGAGAQLQGVFLRSFRFEEPIALTFMNVADQRSMTRWLITAQTSPRFALAAAEHGNQTEAASGSLWQFVVFGFEHILPKGLDHMLFVLGLYLGARSLGSLLLLVTCFTLAHSITLGLASVGLVRLPAGIVEPLISLSIVWIGVENLLARTRTDRYRPLFVFGFGLLHGLGFASALADLQAPRGSFLLSLLSFNAGIEAAQLAVIAIAFVLTFWARGKPGYRRAVIVPASLTIAAVASFWTLQRLLA